MRACVSTPFFSSCIPSPSVGFARSHFTTVPTTTSSLFTTASATAWLWTLSALETKFTDWHCPECAQWGVEVAARPQVLQHAQHTKLRSLDVSTTHLWYIARQQQGEAQLAHGVLRPTQACCACFLADKLSHDPHHNRNRLRHHYGRQQSSRPAGGVQKLNLNASFCLLPVSVSVPSRAHAAHLQLEVCLCRMTHSKGTCGDRRLGRAVHHSPGLSVPV